MKVLLTTDWYKPVINGVVASVVTLAEGLTELGAEVRILTLSGTVHSHRDGNITYIGSVGVGMIYPNARMRCMLGREEIRELIAWQPDIVHSQCEFSTFFLAREIARACDCPLVHTYHTVYEDFTHYFSPSVRFGRYMAAVFSRQILRRTDGVIAPTDKVRDMLHRYGVCTPMAVIPSGLSLLRFSALPDKDEREALREELGLSQDDYVLLYLGRLAKEKNITELLELLSRVEDERVKLLLVGDGPYHEELAEQVRQLGLGERVTFAGMVAPTEVPRYYALGNVFVSASRSETQGLTYIEAMAAGLPLLCREDACLKDLVRDGENGFAYSDAEDFLRKLHALFSDPSAARKMGGAARETVFREFSERGFAQSVLEAYHTLPACHSA